MTLLSVFFTLAGLLGYLRTRSNFDLSRGRCQQLIAMGMYVIGGSVLAVLCKENGILLPLYIIVIESTILLQTEKPNGWEAWGGIFLVLPVALLLVYLLIHFEDVVRSYQFRPYTMEQRLLMGSSVLLTYLKNIVVSSYGVFHSIMMTIQ